MIDEINKDYAYITNYGPKDIKEEVSAGEKLSGRLIEQQCLLHGT